MVLVCNEPAMADMLLLRWTPPANAALVSRLAAMEAKAARAAAA